MFGAVRSVRWRGGHDAVVWGGRSAARRPVWPRVVWRALATDGTSRETRDDPGGNPQSSQTELSGAAYREAAEEFFDDMLHHFDEVDGVVSGLEYEYANGVFTIKMENRGTWVLNKQAPNRQIWWSSPISGPKRYDYKSNEWVNARDPEEKLWNILAREFEQVYGVKLKS